MASSTDFLLALESVTVSFDGFKAVDDLNLYIDYGELRVIIGPNGAGKTTVLDLICGRTRVAGGSIKFKDQEITGCKEQEIVRRGIGRKFQTPTIYEDLTVFENLRVVGAIKDFRKIPTTRSFDNLVGARQELRGDTDAERPRGLEVDDKVEFRRLRDRQIIGLGAVENAGRIGAGLLIRIRDVRSVAEQAPSKA